MPRQTDKNGREAAALIGVLGSVLGMLEGGATHLGVATDHVIESFRNDLWAGYKTSEGIEPELLAQFHPLEDALRAMGVTVWAMEEFEADDALAAAAQLAAQSQDVEQVIICTPDKDLSQCVRGQRVVQLDRRKREVRDEAGVVARFGVGPGSIPDYLALVGDSADGFPGVPGWGEKASGAILGRYAHLEKIPPAPRSGMCRSAVPRVSRRRWRSIVSWRSCFARWPRSGPTYRSSPVSMICGGRTRRRRSSESRSNSACQACGIARGESHRIRWNLYGDLRLNHPWKRSAISSSAAA